MKYPLDPKKEILKWGPTPLKLYYADCLKGIFLDYPKKYPGYGWCDVLILVKNGLSVWMGEVEAINKNGGKAFLELMLPKTKREEVRADWIKIHNELAEMNKQIDSLDLSSLPKKDFMDLYKKYHKTVDVFWVYSTLPELANYGSSEILKKEIENLIPEADMNSVMEVLTAPTGISFYQEEEIDLQKNDDIADHQKKYFWLRNSYSNVEILPVEFFAERKKEIPPNIEEEVRSRLSGAISRKEIVRKKYDLPSRVMDIAEAISDAIVWQDTRKKDIWIYLHYMELMLREAARRLGQKSEDMLNCISEEILEALDKDKFVVDTGERKEAVGVFADDKKIEILDKEKTLEYWKLYMDVVHEQVDNFKGITASKGSGPVKGKVKIILDAHKAEGFEKGNILVTTMTTPEYIFIMKQSSAVVTDTGGLTSHAAIVSRELGVPCIVGTKIATQVLHDGDMVEVDADKGIVRILDK